MDALTFPWCFWKQHFNVVATGRSSYPVTSQKKQIRVGANPGNAAFTVTVTTVDLYASSNRSAASSALLSLWGGGGSKAQECTTNLDSVPCTVQLRTSSINI